MFVLLGRYLSSEIVVGIDKKMLYRTYVGRQFVRMSHVPPFLHGIVSTHNNHGTNNGSDVR